MIEKNLNKRIISVILGEQKTIEEGESNEKKSLGFFTRIANFFGSGLDQMAKELDNPNKKDPNNQ